MSQQLAAAEIGSAHANRFRIPEYNLLYKCTVVHMYIKYTN